MLILLSFAVAPILILLHATYVADRNEKEPIRNLIIYLVGGSVMVIPAYIIESWIPMSIEPSAAGSNFWLLSISILIRIALVEELAKRVALWYCSRNDPEIDEPFDWIVYGVSISLGFALVENIFYVVNRGVSTAVLRAFTAVPSHAFNGTLMGDRLARAARSKGGSAASQRVLAIVEPTLWHASYDILIIGMSATHVVDDRTLFVFVVGLVLIQYVVAASRVRDQQQLATPYGRTPPVLLPEKIIFSRERKKVGRYKKQQDR